MADLLHIRPGLALPLSEIELRTSRSSGPGGQHANVTASRVEASFDVAASETLTDEQRARISAKLGAAGHGVARRTPAPSTATASSRSSGWPSRLAHALEVRRPRTKTRPTRASQKRRVEAKKRRGEIKRARRRPDLD